MTSFLNKILFTLIFFSFADINKRDYGQFNCLDIGYLAMLGCTIGFAVHQLGWLPRQCCQR